MQNNQNVQNLPQSGGMSLEQRFIDLYIQSLLTLQSCWMNSLGRVDGTQFGLQVEFITNLIPNDDIQKRIKSEQVRLTALYKKQGDLNASIRAGMVAVNEAIRFLVTTFELSHLDITGPATDDMYIVIPEVPSQAHEPEVEAEVDNAAS
jgi:hypothetical protein